MLKLDFELRAKNLLTVLDVMYEYIVVCAAVIAVYQIYLLVSETIRMKRLLKLETDEPYSVVGLIRQGTKFLAIGRKDAKNHYSLPGGKIDPGETSYQALVRELKEELGIDVLDAQPIFYDFDDQGKKCILYEILAYEGELVSLEGPEIKLLEASDLINKKICPYWKYNRNFFIAISKYHESL